MGFLKFETKNGKKYRSEACQLLPAKAGSLRLTPNAEASDWTP